MRRDLPRFTAHAHSACRALHEHSTWHNAAQGGEAVGEVHRWPTGAPLATASSPFPHSRRGDKMSLQLPPTRTGESGRLSDPMHARRRTRRRCRPRSRCHLTPSHCHPVASRAHGFLFRFELLAFFSRHFFERLVVLRRQRIDNSEVWRFLISTRSGGKNLRHSAGARDDDADASQHTDGAVQRAHRGVASAPSDQLTRRCAK